jgi:hypothetical protein
MKIQLLVFSLFVSINIFSQGIEGAILDKDKMPISYVQVLNMSTGNHTHSDDIGAFLLVNTNVNDTILLSLLGYENKQVVVKDISSPLVIILNEMAFSMDEIIIRPRIDALNIFTEIDTKINPVSSSQEVLRQVPGLFIGQHAGGGKAEQIFLRGFDVDHGTDVSISADGIPVNMVSHAHGQGYADLHFIIPETINKINFGTGPYYVDQGNFNTAGFVDFETKDCLDNNTLQFELGHFNTHRILGMYNLINNKNNQAYIASEYLSSDGQFESPQNFNRINVFGKYTSQITSTNKISVSVSHFTSQWDASGQIPIRLVNNGTISRFGAVDDTEGGQTSRSNVIFKHKKALTKTSFLTSDFYYSRYEFNLFSNFTFFLDDPINGDQIRQKESRHLYGFKSQYNKSFSLGSVEGTIKTGLGLRNDVSNDNGLAHTLNREILLAYKQFGDIEESNISAFTEVVFKFGKLSINPGLRFDYFDFKYIDGLASIYKKESASQSILSPKLNLLFNASKELQLYIKSGKGFHSNDARVVIERDGSKTLPAAYGLDVGGIWKPFNRLLINGAFWHLFLEQEFIYVGDAGIVEQGGRTKRQGLDLSIRYQPAKWMYWNMDATYTQPRSIDEENGQDHVPLAPNLTLTGGFDILLNSRLFGGMKIRHLADRPANENNSIIAEGYTVVDFNLGYNWRQIRLGLQIQNFLNTAWNEAQFATESQLLNESEPVEEIHFTPGTPFNLKASISYSF